jgi:hypothetical protein
MDSSRHPELDPDGGCQNLCIDDVVVSTSEPGDASVVRPVRSRP